jgi:glucosamine-6-phosphate deaminase
MSAAAVVCTVPGAAKARAVGKTLKGPVSVKCPASILRMHRQCCFFLDAESAEEITGRSEAAPTGAVFGKT